MFYFIYFNFLPTFYCLSLSSKVTMNKNEFFRHLSDLLWYAFVQRRRWWTVIVLIIFNVWKNASTGRHPWTHSEKCFMLTTNEFMGQLFVKFFFRNQVVCVKKMHNYALNEWIIDCWRKGAFESSLTLYWPLLSLLLALYIVTSKKFAVLNHQNYFSREHKHSLLTQNYLNMISKNMNRSSLHDSLNKNEHVWAWFWCFHSVSFWRRWLRKKEGTRTQIGLIY